MFNRRLVSFVLAVLTGLASGLSTSAYADDTDIYLSGTGGGQDIIRPNVLFVLDTSDSMNNIVDSDGDGVNDPDEVSRLENMRRAMVDLIENLDNVNVGFMRFNGRRQRIADCDAAGLTDPWFQSTTSGNECYLPTGGPVLYPVKNLDAPNTDTVGEGDSTTTTLQYQVAESSDDAEELSVTTAVTLDNQVMALTGRQEHEVLRYIKQSTDDGYQEGNGSSPVIKFNDDDGVGPSGGQNGEADHSDRVVFGRTDFVGLRFQDIQIPTGVNITRAEVSFEAMFDQAGTTNVTLYGIANTNPGTFTNTVNEMRDLGRTGTSVPWNMPAWVTGQRYEPQTTSPDLSAIVQELVDTAGWVEGNAMGFVVDDDNPGDDQTDERRAAKSYDYNQGTDHDGAPRLFVTYAVPTEPQRVGVRFQNVKIPQGATVTGAYLELSTALPTNNTVSSSLSVQVEDVDSAATFESSLGNISSRSWSGSVSWNPEEVTTETVEVDEVPVEVPTPAVLTTPNLASLVQTVVDRDGWCGGNDLAFSIVGSGTRAVLSYDAEPTVAPVLRVTYDTTSIPADKGCLQTRQVYQPANGKDDGYEKHSNDSVTPAGNIMLAYKSGFGASQVTTMVRFPGVTIDPDATILSAYLDFTSFSDESGSIALTIKGDDSGNTAQINRVDGEITDTTLRPRTSASVTWNPTDWTTDNVYRSPDLKAVVQEAISPSSGWASGNALGFYIEGSTQNGRRAYSFNNDPSKAPRLVINVQENQAASGGPKTVRERIIELVNEHAQRTVSTLNRTPSVETLFEAAQYWTGGDVVYGKKRGTQEAGNRGARVTRVSHEGSWTGGNLVRPAGCTEEDLSAEVCKDEVITGNPQYVSPFGEAECQNNFMIFLSDGAPTQNGGIQQVEDFTGLSCGDNARGENGKCAYELVNYLKNNDLDGVLPGDQTVTTYTIGFNIGDAGNENTVIWMQDIAANGGGNFYSADTADQLTAVLQSIFTSILSKPTSFASPALSVNAFNKLFHRNDVYFALFKPNLKVRWDGNVKKYKICSDPDGADDATGGGDDCILGEVLDATGASAIGTDSRIKNAAKSLWTIGGADGPTVEVGGAGAVMPSLANRKIYTDLGLSSPASAFGDGTTTGIQLNGSADTMLTAANYEGNTAIRTLACVDPSAGDASCDEDLEWLLGANVIDDDTVRSSSDSTLRWAFHDPLHSSPVIITFGGTDADPIEKVFVGTNDGGLRMLNADTGVEEWVFTPNEFIESDHLGDLKKNDDGEHFYGIDLTPVSRIVDNNSDGVIDPSQGDYVHIYVGQRRGGHSFYALNVTPDSVITNQDVGNITPRFMWRIDGGITAGFERMGYSFSRPLLTDIRVGTGGGESAAKKVLIFGGGYDTAVDSDYGTAGTGGAPNSGNAIYVVDPDDGSRILWISHAAAADGSYTASGADIELDNMVHSIPSDIAGMDSNGDGEVDRLYVGDTGGQVWRIDLGETLAAGTLGGTVAGRLANLASVRDVSDPDGTNERKFFYQPDVVQVRDSTYSSSDHARYDLVVITSGDRANPLDKHVVDRIFAIRDYVTDGPMDDTDDNDGVADAPATVTIADLLDVTDNLIQTGSDDEQTQEITDLQAKSGWYIDLLEPPDGDKLGEKGLAPPIILAGKLFLTTFLPDVGVNPCVAQEGSGRIFSLNVLNATALDEWGVLDSTKTHDGRANTLGAGIPSGAVPIFQEQGVTLLIGTGGGASVVDPNIQLPRERTYWFQESN